MRARDASCLPEFIASELTGWNLKLEDVERWTVGSGPGSFPFLRVVAGLAAGWHVGHDRIQFRCVPGALALAASLKPSEGETVGALYDGRNHELLYFGVRRTGGELTPTGETAVLNAERAERFFSEHADERCIRVHRGCARPSPRCCRKNVRLTSGEADPAAHRRLHRRIQRRPEPSRVYPSA